MIRNLLFDLGGVLYEIDFERTVSALAKFKKPGKDSVDYHRDSQDEVFALIDKGLIDMDDFADRMIATNHLEASREDVLAAWDALLIGPFAGRPEQLAKLRPHFQIALLSNTNFHHIAHFSDECQPMFQHFDHLFKSCEMGMRKPDAEIFQAVLDTMNWKAEETLFVDDAIVNIRGAAALGFQTYHLDTPDIFGDLVAYCLNDAGVNA